MKAAILNILKEIIINLTGRRKRDLAYQFGKSFIDTDKPVFLTIRITSEPVSFASKGIDGRFSNLLVTDLMWRDSL